jgi:hypothetical protein
MIVDIVRSVLEKLDAQGLVEHDDWDEQLMAQMASLELSYRELRDRQRDLIDYSQLSTQAAYFYRYVIGHADFIYQILTKARAEAGAPLFDEEEIFVTSVGGGPASELLGLIKYLREAEGEPEVSKITYTVIDKERHWEHVVDLVVEAVDVGIEIDMIFQACDLSADAISEEVSLEHEDIVIMSYFISEICTIPSHRQIVTNLNNLLSAMPGGALLLYNDSSAWSFHSFFDSRVSAARRFVVVADIREDLRTAHPQSEGVFADINFRTDYGFKLSSNAVAKVLRRD